MEDKLISGNELLAKFMNINIVQSKTSMAKLYHSDEFTLVNGKLAFAYNLKFDKDWNWLKLVLDKIKKDCPVIAHYEITDENRFIYTFFRFNIFTPIEITWEYAVKFVEWFNKL